MSRTCGKSTNIFQEAIDHCRWKSVLHNVLQEVNIKHYENMIFEEIFSEIYEVCSKYKGVGLLSVYDISSAICRTYKIPINRVFIIGGGPKRAIKLLNIKSKKHKINDTISVKYVEIDDIVNAFDNNGFGTELEDNIRNSKNGDIFETFICNWQKKKE